MDEMKENLLINLYPHQIVSVKNMEKLEHFKRVKIDQYTSCETDFGILGDIPGYGKSYSIVSLILNDKMEWDLKQEYIKNNICIYNDSIKTIRSIIKKRTKSNLIVCSVSILKQWTSYLQKAPSLSFCEISTKKDITDFKLDKYDVILLSSNRYNEFIDHVGNNIVWKRFIFDEASSIFITAMRTVNFGFMWLVTATYQYLYNVRGNSQHFIKSFFKNIPYEYLSFFVIKNKDDFIRESFIMPGTQIITHECVNPKVLSILRNHIDNETHTMISAGNIKGAIARLGGNIYSTTNLINIVKQRKEEKITTCKQSIEFWERRNNKKEIDHWVERLHICENEMKDIEEKYKNMLKDDCSICYDQINNHTMVSCCQNIFCGECIIKWFNTNQNCPLCRHLLKLSDISFIGDEEKKEDKERQKTKKQTVIEIIKDCIQRNRKVIVFSSYDETFDIIRSDLYENRISFIELSGRMSTRESKLKNFKDGNVNVIFLNSRFNGAGINLEQTDDIILYHKMGEDIRRQVLGRALRIGRKEILIVHEFKE